MRVTTDAPGGIVAERPMYFHRAIDGVNEINDGHDKPGANALSVVWAFAEGSTLPGFLPFLTVENPNAQATTVTITYTPDDSAPVARTVVVPARSRGTVQVYGPVEQGGIGATKTGFGMFVTSTLPVLVERPFYVRRALPGLPEVNGGSVVVGLPSG